MMSDVVVIPLGEEHGDRGKDLQPLSPPPKHATSPGLRHVPTTPTGETSSHSLYQSTCHLAFCPPAFMSSGQCVVLSADDKPIIYSFFRSLFLSKMGCVICAVPLPLSSARPVGLFLSVSHVTSSTTTTRPEPITGEIEYRVRYGS